MKKLILIAVVILMTGITYSQTLQKGNVVGFHNGTFTPNPDVTMNQCVNFMMTKFLPTVEKAYPGVKGYILKGKRGECVDCISFIYLFASDAMRAKFWKDDGTNTEAGNKADEIMKPVMEEMTKFGKLTDKYTDWVVE